jgi:hypothetical protein
MFASLYSSFVYSLLKVPSDRMPPYIGQIISDGVYNSQLRSNPKHPVSDDIVSCRFINVDGKEQKIQSGSQQVDAFSFCQHPFS